MTQERSTASEPNPQLGTPAADALKRFERLIGTWELRGRTLNSDEDNITGWNTFAWMPGGYFLKSEGEITFQGFVMQSLEMIAYDPTRATFPARVYSSMNGDVVPYEWDLQGDTLIHEGSGYRYTGTFSQDDNTITGGWRPIEGTTPANDISYDAIMTRVS